ncbi:hypothetical protein ILUMI_02221 [Ignelater luminosus]|uniref:Uncharacterized protein n=1 Tax=Ignelater luminosus TaxID=2038154 RepID=A0A8K0GL08_IGNLU|nr:hypothetical protein ILUMI_02221 [Ignelater luminosus]
MIGLKTYVHIQKDTEEVKSRTPKERCMIATDTLEKMLIEKEKKKKIPIKRRLFKVKSSEKEDNLSVRSENSEIDWAGKSSDKEEPEEGNVDLASLNVGDWVAVEYNGDPFPGRIKSNHVGFTHSVSGKTRKIL